MAHLTLDKSNYKAYKDRKELKINPNEFDILWLLASCPNRIFSKEDIEVGLSLEDPYFDKSKLVQQLSSLLRKLDNKLIRMVGGSYELRLREV